MSPSNARRRVWAEEEEAEVEVEMEVEAAPVRSRLSRGVEEEEMAGCRFAAIAGVAAVAVEEEEAAAAAAAA